eukprot:snap_masked-scaffold_101-processed-gene-0.37-mRNA-1 protein AED:1.00 eAED:1.00 QI:0/-1/0/0/-1/1/1/0/69
MKQQQINRSISSEKLESTTTWNQKTQNKKTPTEACQKLELEEDKDIDPVPPIQDPPNHGTPQPIRLRRT